MFLQKDKGGMTLKHGKLHSLKSFLALHNLRYSDIYKPLGYSRQRFSDKINGRVSISLSEMVEILKILSNMLGKSYTLDEVFRKIG